MAAAPERWRDEKTGLNMRIQLPFLVLAGLSFSVSVFGVDESRVHGKAVYEHWCTPCHGASLLKPGTAALQAKYKGAPTAVLEERSDMSAEFVTITVRNGISIMPFFRHTEISDADLEAMAAYLTGKE
jgi:mono/diheme cytochrome c family protein